MFQLTARTLLVFLTSRAVAQRYGLVQTYDPTNFFEEFDFSTDKDTNNGFAKYVSYDTAKSSGLISNDGEVYVGVDSENVVDVDSRGRPSVRLHSKATFTEGLFVLDLSHMPTGCGIWPAFWTVGHGDRGNNGEVDIIEGVNDASDNNVALHTKGNCYISKTFDQTGTRKSTNCNTAANFNQGCASDLAEPNNFREAFNQNGGGVYAMEWTSSSINVWFFARENIPISLGYDPSFAPDVSTFGMPSASFAGPCSEDFPEKFFNRTIILNTSFCGGWAGGSYGTGDSKCRKLKRMTSKESCLEHVANNPEDFAEAYWSINSLRVWQKTDELDTPKKSEASSVYRHGMLKSAEKLTPQREIPLAAISEFEEAKSPSQQYDAGGITVEEMGEDLDTMLNLLDDETKRHLCHQLRPVLLPLFSTPKAISPEDDSDSNPSFFAGELARRKLARKLNRRSEAIDPSEDPYVGARFGGSGSYPSNPDSTRPRPRPSPRPRLGRTWESVYAYLDRRDKAALRNFLTVYSSFDGKPDPRDAEGYVRYMDAYASIARFDEDVLGAIQNLLTAGVPIPADLIGPAPTGPGYPTTTPRPTSTRRLPRPRPTGDWDGYPGGGWDSDSDGEWDWYPDYPGHGGKNDTQALHNILELWDQVPDDQKEAILELLDPQGPEYKILTSVMAIRKRQDAGDVEVSVAVNGDVTVEEEQPGIVPGEIPGVVPGFIPGVTGAEVPGGYPDDVTGEEEPAGEEVTGELGTPDDIEAAVDAVLGDPEATTVEVEVVPVPADEAEDVAEEDVADEAVGTPDVTYEDLVGEDATDEDATAEDVFQFQPTIVEDYSDVSTTDEAPAAGDSSFEGQDLSGEILTGFTYPTPSDDAEPSSEDTEESEDLTEMSTLDYFDEPASDDAEAYTEDFEDPTELSTLEYFDEPASEDIEDPYELSTLEYFQEPTSDDTESYTEEFEDPTELPTLEIIENIGSEDFTPVDTTVVDDTTSAGAAFEGQDPSGSFFEDYPATSGSPADVAPSAADDTPAALGGPAVDLNIAIDSDTSDNSASSPLSPLAPLAPEPATPISAIEPPVGPVYIAPAPASSNTDRYQKWPSWAQDLAQSFPKWAALISDNFPWRIFGDVNTSSSRRIQGWASSVGKMLMRRDGWLVRGEGEGGCAEVWGFGVGNVEC